MTREISAGDAASLRRGEVRAVLIGPGARGRLARQALVLRAADGAIRCYLNLCRHLPIPIDGGSREYLDEEGAHLRCGTHGALFRLADGMCVEGPCEGLPLHPLPIEDRNGELVIVVDDDAMPDA